MPRHIKDHIRRRIKSLITIQRQHRHDIYSKQGTHNNCSGLLHLNKANRVMTLGVRGWQGGRITATPRSSLRFVSGLGTRFDGNLAVRLQDVGAKKLSFIIALFTLLSELLHNCKPRILPQ